MRKTLLLTVILLVFAAWAVAQQGSNSQAPSTSMPSHDAGSKTAPSTDSQMPPSSSSQTSQPSAGQTSQEPSAPSSPSGQASQPPAGENAIEGCLGGSAGNYTIIDKAGTSYKLELPANADTSVLDKHIGQEVRVMGTVSNAAAASPSSSMPSSSASSGSAGSSSASQASIRVSKMSKVGDTCSTSTGAAPSK